MKVWSILLWVASATWFVYGVAVWFGYEPTKLTMSVAFIITGGTVAKWASEAWKESNET